jgi:hypothetical protein
LEIVKLTQDELKVLEILKHGNMDIFWSKFKKYVKNHYPEYNPEKEEATIEWKTGEVTFKEIK